MDSSQAVLYTPTRVKRNSRAPERFSSDDKNVEGSNNETAGLTRKGDKSSKKSSGSSNSKAPGREPLKVKLPKLKRLQSMPLQLKVKISRNNVNTSGVPSISKIKLPVKKPKGNGDASAEKADALVKSPQTSQYALEKPDSDLTPTLPSKNLEDNHDKHETAQPNVSARPGAIDRDTSMEDEADSNISSEGADSSALQATVEKKDDPLDAAIRCPCGVNDDLGVMVECEKCSTWQHGHCINVGIEEDAYEGYICGYCSMPPGKHHDSLQQLTVGDKFQSKFEALETLMRQRFKIQDVEGRTEIIDEKQMVFNQEELDTVVKDLKRVFTSLKVKWRLLTNEDYSTELKLWSHPIWSDTPEENSKQKQQQAITFVGDVYKRNLKSNICNMLNKMHRRCQLIRYQISMLEEVHSSQESKSAFDNLLTVLDDISRVVEEFSDELKQN